MHDITGAGGADATGGVAGAVGGGGRVAGGGGGCAGDGEVTADAVTPVVDGGIGVPADSTILPDLSTMFPLVSIVVPVAGKEGVGGDKGVGVFVGGVGPLVVVVEAPGLEDVTLASKCSVTRVIVSRKARIARTPIVRLW